MPLARLIRQSQSPTRCPDWERILYAALYEAGVRPIPQYSIDQYGLLMAVLFCP